MIKIACFKGLTPKSENLIKRLAIIRLQWYTYFKHIRLHL